jgi:hypothetical protein
VSVLKKKHRRHGVLPHRVFGAEIVKAEKKRGQLYGDHPVHAKAVRIIFPWRERELLRGQMP